MTMEETINNDVIGKKCELKVWHERYKKDGKQEIVLAEGLGKLYLSYKDSEYALVVRQIFDEKNVWQSTKVLINSTHILKAFSKIIVSYPTVPSNFQSSTELESPFQMLFHYWDGLDEYRKSVEDDTSRMHLNLLFEFMETEIGISRKNVHKMIQNNHIGYDQLWTIFSPGDLQYTSHNGQPWLMRVIKTAYQESKARGKWMSVYCTCTNYDGTDVGNATNVIDIFEKRSFSGGHPAIITALPIFPRKFLKDYNGLEKDMIDRGTRFLRLRGIRVNEYNGPAQYLKEMPPAFYDPDMNGFEDVYLPFTETGRIVIDKKTFTEDYRMEAVLRSLHSRGEPEDFSAEERMLCPPFVHGYSLNRKDWCKFDINNVTEISWNINAFENLVLADNKKSLLQALISSHEFPDNPRDQVQQKGKGLVVLLHGTPGSGKTLTAESSAEIAKKAVLTTTMGELNQYDSAWYFERSLKKLLRHATTWKAIVLLDEADVFLEARQHHSSGATERNALVAVFLRQLEYFSGIVFLTTNRIQVMDAAMKSRIHLALGYEPPELDIRRRIWTTSLIQIPASDRDLDLDSTVESLISYKFNGREITNAINTARTLARFEKAPLKPGHIETVLNIHNQFEVLLKRQDHVDSSCHTD